MSVPVGLRPTRMGSPGRMCCSREVSGPFGHLDAVELEVLVVVRAGEAEGAQQRPTLDLQADHHEVPVPKAQPRVPRGGEAEQGVVPVVDVQDAFFADGAHGIDRCSKRKLFIGKTGYSCNAIRLSRYAVHAASARGLPGRRPDRQRQPSGASSSACRSPPPAARWPISNVSSICSCSTGSASASVSPPGATTCGAAPRRCSSTRASSSAGSKGGAEDERLRVGATLTIGNYVAVPLVARFMREHPSAGAHPRGRQHGRDRAPGRQLRARRRFGRGRGRPPGPRDHPVARRPAGRLLRGPASAGAQARAHRCRPARRRPGSCASTAPERVRRSIGRCAACCRSCRWRSRCRKPRRSSGPSRPAWGSAACRGSPSRMRSSAAR